VLRLDVPPELAYGDDPPSDGTGTIRAGDAITYVVEIMAVLPVLRPEDAPLDIDVAPSIDADELRIDDLIDGDGEVVEEGDRVIVAMLLVRGDNQVVIFNSWDQRSPLTIRLDRSLMDGPEPATLPGIFDGVLGARVGGRRAIAMPPELAWGEDGLPTLGLPPGVDLIAIVDILGAY
jgi:peptidylprolyl isomerase